MPGLKDLSKPPADYLIPIAEYRTGLTDVDADAESVTDLIDRTDAISASQNELLILPICLDGSDVLPDVEVTLTVYRQLSDTAPFDAWVNLGDISTLSGQLFSLAANQSNVLLAGNYKLVVSGSFPGGASALNLYVTHSADGRGIQAIQADLDGVPIS